MQVNQVSNPEQMQNKARNWSWTCETMKARLRSRQLSLRGSLKTSSTQTEACKEPGIVPGRACNRKARCRSQKHGSLTKGGAWRKESTERGSWSWRQIHGDSVRERERQDATRLTAAISKGETVSAVMSIACVNQNRSWNRSKIGFIL